MFRLAWRNLMFDRGRLAISASGVALAVLLILLLSGIFAGSEAHAVAYMRNQPAELWLMQAGVENLHMSSSLLPPDALRRVREVDGVGEAVGLLYASAGVKVGESVVYSYIFAVDGDAPFGGPWVLAAGGGAPGLREVVIDQALADRYGLGVGDKVSILGFDLTIAGLSRETFGMATSMTWVNRQSLGLLMEVAPGQASYILVQPAEGADPARVAADLGQAVPEANILSRETFIENDRTLIRQMGTDIIGMMTFIGYVVGLMVVALTVYVATLERSREYGLLKALGARTEHLLAVVVTQAFVSAGIGFFLGVLLSYMLGAAISRLLPDMLVLIESANVIRQIPVLALVTGVAALLPLGRIVRLDPMVVFNA